MGALVVVGVVLMGFNILRVFGEVRSLLPLNMNHLWAMGRDLVHTSCSSNWWDDRCRCLICKRCGGGGFVRRRVGSRHGRGVSCGVCGGGGGSQAVGVGLLGHGHGFLLLVNS